MSSSSSTTSGSSVSSYECDTDSSHVKNRSTESSISVFHEEKSSTTSVILTYRGFVVAGCALFGILFLVSLFVLLYFLRSDNNDVPRFWMVWSEQGGNRTLKTLIEKEDVKRFHPDAFVAPFDYLTGTTPDGQTSYVIYLRNHGDLVEQGHMPVIYVTGTSSNDVEMEPFDVGDIDEDAESIEVTVELTTKCQCCDKSQLGSDCLSDGACSLQEICENGKCDRGCRDDSKCPPGEVCGNGFCVTEGLNPDEFEDDFNYVESCYSDFDCESSYICQNGICVYGCRNDFDCEIGLICKNSRCVSEIFYGDDDENLCFSNSDCSVRQKCSFGVCVFGCDGSLDCSWDETCEDGICQADAFWDDNSEDDPYDECYYDYDCDIESICKWNTCVPGCKSDWGCTGDRECQNGFCMTPWPGDERKRRHSEEREEEKRKPHHRRDDSVPFYLRNNSEVDCRVDLDCQDIEICWNGFCIEGCRQSSDCAAHSETRKYCRRNMCLDDLEYIGDMSYRKTNPEFPEWSDSTFKEGELNQETWNKYWKSLGVQNYPNFEYIVRHRFGHMYQFKSVTGTVDRRNAAVAAACSALVGGPWSAVVVFSVIAYASQFHRINEIIRDEALRYIETICDEKSDCRGIQDSITAIAISNAINIITYKKGIISYKSGKLKTIPKSEKPIYLYRCHGHCLNKPTLVPDAVEHMKAKGFDCEAVWGKEREIYLYSSEYPEWHAKKLYLTLELSPVCNKRWNHGKQWYHPSNAPKDKYVAVKTPCIAAYNPSKFYLEQNINCRNINLYSRYPPDGPPLTPAPFEG